MPCIGVRSFEVNLAAPFGHKRSPEEQGPGFVRSKRHASPSPDSGVKRLAPGLVQLRSWCSQTSVLETWPASCGDQQPEPPLDVLNAAGWYRICLDRDRSAVLNHLPGIGSRLTGTVRARPRVSRSGLVFCLAWTAKGTERAEVRVRSRNPSLRYGSCPMPGSSSRSRRRPGPRR